MELPKNVTQIGESDKRCKIYVEDYVVSYIKQLNPLARNKDMAVALYGTRRTENDITYIFVYGACKLDYIQREVKHLSQAQHQEIEKLRRKYFTELTFQGYRLLDGEMVEGFYIYEQDICRYVGGYAQFYEKNESMLSFMLAARLEDVVPEKTNQEKYEAVKRRREERREETQVTESGREKRARLLREKSMENNGSGNYDISGPGLWKMRVATAAVFAVLCMVGIGFLWDEQNTEDLQVAARNAIAELTEQKLPDLETEAAVESQSGTLIIDDGLTEALMEENAGDIMETSLPEGTVAPGATIAPDTGTVSEVPPTPEATVTPETTLPPTPEPTLEPVFYTIQQGDTLIGISISEYGNDFKVQEICALNNISDPDDVKVGQVILLPAS